MFTHFKGEHQEILPYCRLSYWNGGTACGKDDPWTRVNVEGPGGHPCFEIERAREYDKGKLLSALRQAFEQGKLAKAKELRAVLGVEDR